MLFEEQISRKPDKYPWTKGFIDTIWAGFWTPNEFDFKADVSQFHSELSTKEREIVVRTLSAIGQVEIAVKRFWANLGENLPHPSISDLGFVMAQTEVIHNIAYEKLLTVLGLSEEFEKNLSIPEIKGRVEYLRKHTKKVFKDTRKQYIYSIILFTLFVENVSLFSQFYTILYFRRFKNYLKDTANQVNYTRNEEALHANIGIKIIKTLKEEYPELFDEELYAKIKKEVNDAYKAESKIVDWILGDFEEDGLNPKVLKYFIADRMNESMKEIGIDMKIKVDESLKDKVSWFYEDLLANSQTDFFNSKPIDYTKKTRDFGNEELF